MNRRPGSEPSDEQAFADASASADSPDASILFMELLSGLRPGTLAGVNTLDLGCGPGGLTRRFLHAYPQALCDAVDASPAMLEHARKSLESHPDLMSRCQLICERIPSSSLPDRKYDLVFSDGLLHHFTDPRVLWQSIRSLGRPGAMVLVMDLMRPASPGWVEALVETYFAKAPEVLRKDFRNGLFASFEPREIEAQLHEAQLTDFEVAVVSDRHLAAWGRLPQ